MAENLQVLLDFNLEKFPKLDFETLVDSLIKFLNCYSMQSAVKKYRIILALPYGLFNE